VHELAQRAVAAYAVYAPDRVHPVDMAGDQKDRLAAWLSNRMNMTVVLPRLDAAGFALLGGRLMVGEKAPAALLMYENGQGRRLIL
jgi:anti-sigma factor RsiW